LSHAQPGQSGWVTRARVENRGGDGHGLTMRRNA
jgi:hypothetical protein